MLCRTGDVFTAGYNDNGQCGQGTTQRVGVLTRVPILSGRRAVQVGDAKRTKHGAPPDHFMCSLGQNPKWQVVHRLAIRTSLEEQRRREAWKIAKEVFRPGDIQPISPRCDGVVGLIF